MHDGDLTITRRVHFSRRSKGRREIKAGPQPVPDNAPEGTVPRISRLMALAVHFEHLIRSGAITDQAELARLGYVSRARVTQVMNLLHLAPDVQEAILFLPRTTSGRDSIRESHIRPIAAEVDLQRQKQMWRDLCAAMP